MRRSAIAAVLLALTAGCTAADPAPTGAGSGSDTGPLGPIRLVAFDSCEDTMAALRKAAKEYADAYAPAWGMRGGMPEASTADNAGKAAAPPAAPGAADAPVRGSDYSGTNSHERDADEPDLVKTDGRRIVTVRQGVLEVVDVSSKRVTSRLDLARGTSDPIRWGQPDLLLQGDHVLVLLRGGYPIGADFATDPGSDAPVKDTPGARWYGSRLFLVDIAGGGAKLASSYTMDGQLVDARQTGSIARIVITSGPRFEIPPPVPGPKGQGIDQEQWAEAREQAIDRAGPDEWLPRYQVTNGDRTTTGRIDCTAVSRPATFTGTSITTVLSFDLDKSTLGSGDGVSVIADGQTVYSNGTSLYLATDQRWRGAVIQDRDTGRPATLPEEQTEVYRFELNGAERPRYAAGGSVPGWLINQYAMSEWDGHLRVATTSGQMRGNDASSSGVYVLRQQGRQLVQTGRVTGLGKGERIYAVRFLGTVGYVVTFRQTDPLYTVDLKNPAAPKVTGELKITGYSAYLHPVGDNRLIGIGQEANQQGRVQGLQISLFDVRDPAAPERVTQYHIKGGRSDAEFDPHAFLYWPKSGLLVVPLAARGKITETEALVLAVKGDTIADVGAVSHPTKAGGGNRTDSSKILRAIIIDDVLWTVSDAGMRASNPATLQTLAWVDL